MPEQEEEQSVLDATPVPSSMITPETNPAANGWYEPLTNDSWNVDFFPTTDTSPVDGKTYYIVNTSTEGVSNMSETAMAYSTYQTYFMYRTTTSGSYTKVVDIKDYPDMLGDPNMLDCTTLSDGMEKRIPGILQSGDGYSFTANYTPANFAKVKALVGHQYDYALWLGGTSTGEPDGHNGKFSWTGDVVVGFPGKGVDEVQDMSITAVPSTDTVWTEN